jgi:putative radical SAM enzyme (TIGR03279 family)
MGRVRTVAAGGLGSRLGIKPGDQLLEVNGHAVEDVIDVQFYAAEDRVELVWFRDGIPRRAEADRRPGEGLGLEFDHPTFDIDIRRCNNLCSFCFVLQTAPHMRRTLYIKDDDYRYSFLFGHFVTLTNLKPRDWERIVEQHLSPLYVSVHSTELELRRACLANPSAPDILDQIRFLVEKGIELHAQVVLLPGRNDGEHLDRSLTDLARFYPGVRSCTVVPVGLTRHQRHGHRPFTPEECRSVLDQVETRQQEFLGQMGSRFGFLTDEWYLVAGRPIPANAYYEGLDLRENGLGMVRDFLNDWAAVRREVSRLPRKAAWRRATLVTGTLFAPTLKNAAQEFNLLAGSALEVRGVTNARLGSTVTVAGLLMGREVIQALQVGDPGELLVLPRRMFDHPQALSLDDISPLEVARELRVPVYLGDSMGDVLHALQGTNPLSVRPEDAKLTPQLLRAGGWAVEKNLPSA